MIVRDLKRELPRNPQNVDTLTSQVCHMRLSAEILMVLYGESNFISG